MPWQWKLAGDPLDLAWLPYAFPTGGMHVERRAEEFWLVDEDDSDNSYERSKRIVLRMNGWMRTSHPTFRPATLAGNYIDPSGSTGINLELEPAIIRFVTGPLELRGGTAVPPPGPELLELAEMNAAVADVLDLLGVGVEDFVVLYKVYEVIKVALGGGNGIVAAGFATKAELDAFTATMNRPDVSGDMARHARTSGSAPSRSMSASQASAFARRLAEDFLRSCVKE